MPNHVTKRILAIARFLAAQANRAFNAKLAAGRLLTTAYDPKWYQKQIHHLNS